MKFDPAFNRLLSCTVLPTSNLNNPIFHISHKSIPSHTQLNTNFKVNGAIHFNIWIYISTLVTDIVGVINHF